MTHDSLVRANQNKITILSDYYPKKRKTLMTHSKGGAFSARGSCTLLPSRIFMLPC